MSLGTTRRPGRARPPNGEPLITRVSAKQSVSLRFYVQELWKRRDLVRVLAARQLKSQYEVNVVGFVWWMLEPLSLTLVYWVIVAFIFDAREPAYPLFVIISLLPFKWLHSALTGSMNTMRSNASLITDVYFPRALLPLVEIVVGLAHFAVGLTVIAVLMAVYRVVPTMYLLWVPVVMVVQFLLLMALAYPMAVWGLYYRNLVGLSGNLFRLWFYLSPGIWALERLDGTPGLQTLIKLNPLTGIFVSYRNAILHGEAPRWELLWTLGVALVALLIGARYFLRREAQFGKVI